MQILRQEPQDIPCDSEKCLTLVDGREIACAGISYGLEDYYFMFRQYAEFAGIEEAVQQAEGKWGITQMQAAPGTKALRTGINYRSLLMTEWEQQASKEGVRIEFYLSAELNLWHRFRYHYSVAEQGIRVPSKKCFLYNYDYVAKKHGFRQDKRTRLFIR